MLGQSAKFRILIVCHCYRENDELIRIISARKATTKERRSYPVKVMRREYDFSDARRNPYAAKLKKQITIRLDENVIDYFKSLAVEFDIPYQNLINLYLKDCTFEGRKPKLKWTTRNRVTNSA